MPKESLVRYRSPIKRGNFGRKGRLDFKTSAVSCAETAEPIAWPFGLWTRVSQRKHYFIHIRQVAPNVADDTLP